MNEEKKPKIGLKELRSKNYREKSLERDCILFNWKSDDIKLPLNPEFWVTTHGSIGFLIKEKKWVRGTWKGLLDEYGDFTEYVWHSLNTNDVKTGTSLNHSEVIVCGNTPLYRPFEEERSFYADMKAEADLSILCQLLLSRLTKGIMVENDQQKKAVEKAFKEVILGYPLILTTPVLQDLNTIDLTDNSDIERMQYLSSFFQTLEKREANDFGVDLDLIDKRAQVSNKEINQYDDVTTLEYLIMFEMRQRFVQEMKENGFNIEIVKNPVFYDEPEEKDVEEGTFEAAEAAEEEPAPEEGKEGEDNAEDNQAAV